MLCNLLDDLVHLLEAFLHLLESRIAGSDDYEGGERLDFAYRLWKGPLLIAGGYDLASARKLVDEEYPVRKIVVIFGRYFIANPDLVYRIREGLELSAFDVATFYTTERAGYSDYPFSEEYLASVQVSA